MAETRAIPEGFSSLTAHLVCRDAVEAIEFYQAAFGAEEMGRMLTPDGKTLVHASLRIGDSMLMLVDENPDWECPAPQTLGGSPVAIHLYVEDADAAVERAVKAGGRVTMPLVDAFWGDRFDKLEDPYGHSWSVATHIRDVSPEELEAAAREMFQDEG